MTVTLHFHGMSSQFSFEGSGWSIRSSEHPAHYARAYDVLRNIGPFPIAGVRVRNAGVALDWWLACLGPWLIERSLTNDALYDTLLFPIVVSASTGRGGCGDIADARCVCWRRAGWGITRSWAGHGIIDDRWAGEDVDGARVVDIGIEDSRILVSVTTRERDS